MATRAVVRMQRDCGALANGSSADNNALVSAIWMLHPHGGRIEFEPGNYVFNQQVFDFMGLSLDFVGLGGREAVTITTPYAPGLDFRNLRGSAIRNMMFNSPRPGFGLTLRQVYGLVMENIRFVNFQSGLLVGDEADGMIGSVQNLVLRQVKFDGDASAVNGDIVQIRNANGMSGYDLDLSGHSTSHGLHFVNNGLLCDTFTFTNMLVKGCGYGVRAGEFGPANNVNFFGLRIDDNHISGLHLEPGPTVPLYAWQAHGLWIKSYNYAAIMSMTAAGSSLKDSYFNGLILDPVYQHGLVVQGPSNSFERVYRDGQPVTP